MVRLFAYSALASWTIVTAACLSGAETAPGAEIIDSAGVQIVLNSGVDHPLDLHYNKILTLGGEDAGPASFYQVARHLVAVDGRGDVVVLDRSAYRAVKFSSDGEFLFSVGREGEGPGEFKRPLAVAATADGGFAVLGGRRRLYVHFGETGELIDEAPARSLYSNFHFIDGALVSQGLEYTADGNREFLLLSTESDTTTVAATELTETVAYRLEGCGPMPGMAAPVIFAPELEWDANWTSVAVNDEPGYVVNILNATADVVRSVRRDIPVQNATTELALQWAQKNPTRVTSSAGECVYDARDVVDKRGFASFVPAIGEVALAPDGSVWVQRSAFVADSGKIDVFDPSGQYVGTLPDGSKMPIGFTPSGHVVLVERDDLDVERVAIVEILIDERSSGVRLEAGPRGARSF